MTEIPEHLLKRSKERRQALGLPGGEDAPAGAATPAPASAAPPARPAAATPAPARPATPAAPAAPPPPPPVPPYVRAANERPRIPIWALPVLALLPLWMFFYWKAMQPPKKESVGPTAAGAVVYAKCASCHGSGGEGVSGAGRQLSSGEVLKTFPKIQDQLTFVYTGNKPWAGKGYGDPNRAGGQHVAGQQFPAGGMPSWGNKYGGELTDLQVLEVVCHERFDLSGEDTANPEYTSWCTDTGDNYQKVASGGFAAANIATAPPS